MSILNALEQKVLFSLTRVLTLLVVIGLAVGIVLGTVQLISAFSEHPSDKVAYSAISKRASEVMKAKENSGTPGAANFQLDDVLTNLRLGATLESFLKTRGNPVGARDTIRGLVKALDVADRQAWLDEFNTTLTSAQKAGEDQGGIALAFFQMKEDAIGARKQAEAARETRMKIAGGAVSLGLVLVALFSLVLVLLAIERNTRDNAV